MALVAVVEESRASMTAGTPSTVCSAAVSLVGPFGGGEDRGGGMAGGHLVGLAGAAYRDDRRDAGLLLHEHLLHHLRQQLGASRPVGGESLGREPDGTHVREEGRRQAGVSTTPGEETASTTTSAPAMATSMSEER